ncbi:MAG: hypothetical protein V1887_02440 [Candidatus Aenigmatarchaeota archaeon]
MGEFLVILVAGLVIMVAAYAAVNMPSTGVSGAFLGTQKQNIVLGENVRVVNLPYLLVNSSATVTREQGWMLPFNVKPEDWQAGVLGFTVLRHTDFDLVFTLNGQEMYRGKPSAGRQTIAFPIELLDTENVLEATVESLPWESPSYTFDAQVYGTVLSGLNQSFLAPSTFKHAYLNVFFSKSQGKMAILLDGNEIYNKQPADSLKIELDISKGKEHNIEIVAEPGSREFIDFARVEFDK